MNIKFARVFRNQRIFFTAAIFAFTFIAPAVSYAQDNQKIVMRCTYDGYNNQTLDYVIDLGARTVSLTHTIEIPGAQNVVQSSQANVTQITDDQITWASSNQYASNTDTLNRYTGQVVEQVTMPEGNHTNTMSCQRQQKQF
jgi:hypothetical protein